ncbi:MAG: methylisocitrate lyase [Micavibrio sp.]|nr:MAG: methylisocitrate lyase [Micavibrio sp.]
MGKTAGKRLREAMQTERPLHMIGVADGSDALEAEKAGFKALYLSGSQVAASRGWADIGRLELKHIIEAVERIRDSGTTLPLLVDVDTGFDDPAETVQALEAAGAAAVQIEDQQDLKMCGHLDGKHVVTTEEMAARIKKAVAAKADPDFVVMARTDALAAEADRLAAETGQPKTGGDIQARALDLTLARITAYAEAGADMIFAEAFPDPATYEAVKNAAGGLPVLANMTEFGKIDLLTPEELDAAAGGAVDIVLNPLSVYRAQRQTAAEAYRDIRKTGSQRGLVKDGKLQKRGDFQALVDYDGQVAARAEELAQKDRPQGGSRSSNCGTKQPGG